MTPAEFQRARILFDCVLNLTPDARRAYLDQELAGQAELRRTVETLVADAGERTAMPAIPRLVRGACDSVATGGRTGQRIGAYELVREVGCGGMGTVYEALRVDGAFSRRVAIKLLRRELADTAMADRLRVELELMGRLEHPNICRLYDGGTTDAGEPFEVMEYVDGIPITSCCRGLPLAGRLKLFGSVLEAIAYAHERGVLHLDLKPANILVDAAGAPHVLDFSIAQVFKGGPVRLSRDLPFTPDYASPEQIRGMAVSPASDIYSLGVLLFEMLTGEHPYRLGGATLAEMRTALAHIGLPRCGAAAALTHSRRVRAGLDGIIAKAVELDPARRQRSAQELAREVRKQRDRLPEARPRSAAVAAIALAAGIGSGLIAGWEIHRVWMPGAHAAGIGETATSGAPATPASRVTCRNAADKPGCEEMLRLLTAPEQSEGRRNGQRTTEPQPAGSIRVSGR